MGSEKVARWEGTTKTHGFAVKVFGDREQGLFTAYVEFRSLALSPVVRGGQKTSLMEVDEPVKIGPDDDFEVLRARVRKYVTERGGEILQWRDLEPG